MREEKVPLSLARDQMLGVETSPELTAQRANKAVGQRDRYRANALRLACENLTLRGCCARTPNCGWRCFAPTTLNRPPDGRGDG